MINNDIDDYFVSEIQTYGVKVTILSHYYATIEFKKIIFQVILHDSYDFPGFGATNAIVPAGKNYFISVNPTQSYATPAYRSMSYEVRECLFDGERKLHIFNKYSWVNCMTECRILILHKYCGCVPYFVRNNNGKNRCMCNLSLLRLININFNFQLNGYQLKNLVIWTT